MNTLKHLLVLSLALILAAAVASAQNGTVQGTIKDPSGGAIVGANVTALNQATGVETARTTNEAGLYVLQLAAGEYKIQVSAPGFQTSVRQNVPIDALASVSLDLELQVGATTSEVTVDASAVAVQTDNVSLGASMRNDVYAALPLAMSQGVPRDPTSFVALAPGVATVVLQSAGPSYTSFNGAQQETNGLYFEGLPIIFPNQQGDTRPIALGVSVDAVNQFQVEVNGQKAQYQGQGFHNYVIKSGSNQFHGSLFEYFRNTIFDARGFFSPFVPKDQQNEYGGNVGGYIKKDKLFFFGNYDAYVFNTATAPTVLTVPSLAARTGNFSQLGTAIYDPASQVCTGTVCTKTLFPGGVIPANRLSRVSQSFQSYLPNPTGSTFVNNYIQPLQRSIKNRNTTEKVDYNINENHRVYGVFAYGQWKTDYTGNLTPTGTALPLPYTATPGIVVERPWIMQLHESWVVSPTLLNNFGIGMVRLSIPIFSVTADGNYPQKAGLTGLPTTGQGATGFPGISFTGPNVPNNWAGGGPFNEWENDYVVQDTMQWVHGSHVTSIGGSYTQLQDNRASPASGTSATFSFSNAPTAGFTANSSTLINTTGNAYASYLLGAPVSAAITNNNVVGLGSRFKNFAIFGQNDWKVNKALTVNFGLRWDVFYPFQEQYNRLSYFVPTLPNPGAGNIPGALAYGGQPVDTHWKNIQPRLGLAYAIDPKTVFRAGFTLANTVGTAGLGGNGAGGTGVVGYNPPTAIASIVTGQPVFNWDQGVVRPTSPFPLVTAGFGAGNSTANPAGAVSPNYVKRAEAGKAPYYLNWSAGFDRQLPSSIVVQATYSASVGHFLPRSGDNGIWTNSMLPKYLGLGTLLNSQATPATVAAAQVMFPEIRLPFSNFQGTIANMLAPFPQYAGLSCYSCNLGNSTYHSVQITANRRVATSLTLQAAYTLAKEIDNLPGGGQLGTVGGTRNPFDGKLDRGLGVIDRRHNLNLTALYRLPFGSGALGGKNKAVHAIAGGWTVSGIYKFVTGAPLGITASGCNVPGISSTCTPSLNPAFTGNIMNADWGEGNVLSPGAASYINKSAFVNPAPYTFGNAPRSEPFGLRAPSLWNLDMNIRKEVVFREHYRLQIVGDFFNILNTVIFGAPGTNIDNANFGQLTSAANAPRKIQLAARFSF